MRKREVNPDRADDSTNAKIPMIASLSFVGESSEGDGRKLGNR